MVLRTLAAAALLLFTACVHGPRSLPRHADVLAALEEGRAVRAVVHYGRCQLFVDGKEEPSVDAVGGLAVAAVEHFAKGVVHNDRAYTAISETRTIVHPRYGAVSNYARLRLFEDGEVEVTAKYLKPPALEVVMDETFKCRLGDAVQLFAD
jgi:hypothetical protein